MVAPLYFFTLPVSGFFYSSWRDLFGVQCYTLLHSRKTLRRKRPIQKDLPTAPRLRFIPVVKTFCRLSGLQKKLAYCPPEYGWKIYDKRENVIAYQSPLATDTVGPASVDSYPKTCYLSLR